MHVTTRKRLDDMRIGQIEQGKIDLVNSLEGQIKRNPNATSFAVSFDGIPRVAGEAVVKLYESVGWAVRIDGLTIVLDP